VSDAAGEAADGFHFLGLAELIFENAARGDVFGDASRTSAGSSPPATARPLRANGDDDAVLALPADFKAVNAASAADSSTSCAYSRGSTKTSFCGLRASTSSAEL